jgi:hypothetical protein
VRNLRAAGGEATLTRSRRTEKIAALELVPEQGRTDLALCVADGLA